MAKKVEPTVNEFECPGCKEKLSLGTKKCKWCGMYIANPPETSQVENTKKQSVLDKFLKKS